MKKVFIILALAAGLSVLYFVNPEQAWWVPKCIFRSLTGLECPACGIQRAAHQLLHLRIGSALHYNPFLVVSCPYLLALVTIQWFDPRDKLHKVRTFCHHHITVKTYLALIAVWWIARNIWFKV